MTGSRADATLARLVLRLSAITLVLVIATSIMWLLLLIGAWMVQAV
ncbi:MAG: hypothetical protein ACLP7Q_24115 [Isosphaeraceae bacterium]